MSAASNRPVIAILLPPSGRRLVLSPAAEERLGALGRVRTTDEATLSEPLVRELVTGATVCLTGWGSPSLTPYLPDAPHLGLVGHFAGSVRHLIPAAALDDGLQITHAAGAIGDSVAEFTLAQILLALRHGDGFDRGMKAGQGWDLRDRYPGRLLGAMTVGIVGGGYVGRAVVRLLRAFGARVVMVDPLMSAASAHDLGVDLLPLADMLRRADVVSLHAPLLPETRGMIGAGELALLKDGALFVNLGRGALVDEPALIAELRSGRIRAALDVFETEPLPADSPLRSLDTVLLSPHAAGHTEDSHLRQGDLIVAEVERFLKGEPLRHAISAAAFATMA